MANLKIKDDTGKWIGIPSIQGEPGEKGEKGDTGAGVIPGGLAGQYLRKLSDTDYDTEWADVEGGEVPIYYVTDSTNPFALYQNKPGIYVFPQTTFRVKTGENIPSSSVNTLDGRLIVYKSFEDAEANEKCASYSDSSGGLVHYIKMGTGYGTSKIVGDIIKGSTASTITAKHTYNTLPESSVVPTTDNQFVNKAYVDSVAGGGGDVDLSNYLAKDNSEEFTPTGDYNPATKGYVDNNKSVNYISDYSSSNPFIFEGKKPGLYVFTGSSTVYFKGTSGNLSQNARGLADNTLHIFKEYSEASNSEAFGAYRELDGRYGLLLKSETMSYGYSLGTLLGSGLNFVSKSGTQNLSNQFNFTSSIPKITSSTTPTEDTQIITKGYVDNAAKGTILWDLESGSNETVLTLSDAIENYTYVEIIYFFYNELGSPMRSSGKVPTASKVSLGGVFAGKFDGVYASRLYTGTCDITGTTVSKWIGYSHTLDTSGGVTFSETNNDTFIRQIIGYK